MQITTTENVTDFGEWLYRQWRDGTVEPDDWHTDPETGEGFAQFGRRVIVDYENGRPIEYTRHPDIAAAVRQMTELHNNRGPVWDWDAVVSEDRGGYVVSIEGVQKGSYADRDDAYLALARAMVDAGCFPDAFYVNDRGNWHRIDDEIRELHDAGGDRMREDLRVE